ncbi:hypothetical protein GH733_007865 [Mirounga leonina]|nr:hypothetical protein GH733_007865 [Mirounga leonina]
MVFGSHQASSEFQVFLKYCMLQKALVRQSPACSHLESRGLRRSEAAAQSGTVLHLIHWNSTLFGSIDEAVGKPHGIAIIALFVQSR